MMFPVFDLHCDTAFAMLGTSLDESISLQRNSLHIDLERAGELPGYAQCFACFTSTADVLPLPVPPDEVFRLELNGITTALQRYRQWMRQAFSGKDAQAHRSDGFMSCILTIEGPAGFQYDPARLEQLWDLGFRITTLGWNEKSPLAGSHATGGGLTAQGAAYVRQAQRLGMLVDVSHISDEAFWDIINITEKPVIASHSNSRSVWNVSRNLTDEMFLALCHTGGVTGINLYADFLGDPADLDTVCDHIIHFLMLDPSGKHICLGGDLDGCAVLPRGFSGVQDYPQLAEQLLKRHVPETTVRDIFWNNAVRVMEHM